MHTLMIFSGKLALIVSAVGGLFYSTWPEPGPPPAHERYILMCPDKWYYVTELGNDQDYFLFRYDYGTKIAKRKADAVVLESATGKAVIGSDVREWWPECEEHLNKMAGVSQIEFASP